MNIKTQMMHLKHYKDVSKEEYQQFVANYNGELIDHSVYFCTPAMHGKYDFDLNPWDEDATVCGVAFEYESFMDIPENYRIVDNIEEIKNFVKENNNG